MCFFLFCFFIYIYNYYFYLFFICNAAHVSGSIGKDEIGKGLLQVVKSGKFTICIRILYNGQPFASSQ